MSRASTRQERELLSMLCESRGAAVGIVVYFEDVNDEDAENAELVVLGVQSTGRGIKTETDDLIGLLSMATAMIREGDSRRIVHEPRKDVEV